MRHILQRIIANRPAVYLGVIIALLAGVYSLLHLPVDLFPGMNVPVVTIVSHYPGAAPQEMELLVTRPIEDKVRGVQGAKRVSSTSVQGISLVTVEFNWGTRLVDVRQLIRAALAPVRGQLPSGVESRLENIGTTLQEVVGYVVYGGTDSVSLRNIVRLDLAARLMGVQNVQRVEVLGGDERAFVVKLHRMALTRFHLTVDDVIDVLRRNNVGAAVGYMERGSREYPIRGDGRVRSVQDLRALPIQSHGANSVLLGSVASISEGRTPRHYVVHGDGVPAVAFVVYKQPEASTIRVAKDVGRQVERLKSLLPAGAQVKKFYDQSEIIVEARNSLTHDLMAGAVLAMLVLYMFLGTLRAMVIVAATIPISLTVSLVLMKTFGLSLNVITISALTLALGMVVDDAIVVTENIFRHLQLGAAAPEASVNGAAEIAAADASGTFTTAAAFFPLVVVGGLAGVFLKPFGLVISMALLASLVASLTFVPAAFSGWRRAAPGAGALARPLLRFDRLLRGCLRWAFAHRGLTLALAGLSMGLIGLVFLLRPAHVLPPVEEGAILIEYVMPPGTALSESDSIGNKLEHLAMADPDVSCVYRRTGSPASGIQVESVNSGEITIKLRPRALRRRSTMQIMESLRASFSKVPGVVFLYHQPTQEKMDESFSGLPALFGVTIFGPDVNRLIRLAESTQKVMANDPALSNIVNNTKIKAPQIVVRLDHARLGQYRLSAADVLHTIQAARFGVEAGQIIRGRERIRVLVKVDYPIHSAVASLRHLLLSTPDGASVPLEHVADVQVKHSPAAITRLNGQRQITILAEVQGSTPAVVRRLRDKFAHMALPKGYSVEFTGEYRLLMRTIRDLALVVFGAIVLIYMIMVIQFRSWVQPVIILVAIPFAMLGSLVALVVARQSVNVSVGMGLLTLTGIAVNNAIVLLDYANRRRRKGQTMAHALIDSASVRLRPILMTALTTIFALLPIALSRSVGSKIFQPFAVTVIGGLIAATLVTLILIPTLMMLRRSPNSSHQPPLNSLTP